MKFEPLKLEDVSFELTYTPCWDRVEDHFDDEEMIEYVNDELRSGNDAAWFDVAVAAKYKIFTAYSYLSCCSYNSFKEFEEDAYMEDLKNQALDAINEHMQEVVNEIADRCIVSGAKVKYIEAYTDVLLFQTF